jgi:hypothetical protein
MAVLGDTCLLGRTRGCGLLTFFLPPNWPNLKLAPPTAPLTLPERCLSRLKVTANLTAASGPPPRSSFPSSPVINLGRRFQRLKPAHSASACLNFDLSVMARNQCREMVRCASCTFCVENLPFRTVAEASKQRLECSPALKMAAVSLRFPPPPFRVQADFLN